MATPETPSSLGVCSKYANNSCCSPSVAEQVPKARLYGDLFTWERCDGVPSRGYSMSEKCRQWFRDELCLYECDAQIGAIVLLWRVLWRVVIYRSACLFECQAGLRHSTCIG